MTFIETERILLRRFSPKDLPALVKHRSELDVMRYLGGVQEPNIVENRLSEYMKFYDKHNYSMGAMIWKKSSEFIGVGGLIKSDLPGETEVGFTVERRYWRQGIATECAAACLEYGFQNIGLKRIIALTNADNIGSRRVLEKAGMKLESILDKDGESWVKYSVAMEEYGNGKAFPSQI